MCLTCAHGLDYISTGVVTMLGHLQIKHIQQQQQLGTASSSMLGVDLLHTTSRAYHSRICYVSNTVALSLTCHVCELQAKDCWPRLDTVEV
jgi:hypothetical protein